MKLHLVDGTYELFRAYFAVPSTTAPDGREVGALRGLVQTLLKLLRQDDVTHVGIAFDHVVESFRNDLFDGYKTGEGMDPALWAQFHPAEDAARALGLVVWPMIEFEADDALATAATKWSGDAEIDQVVVCSPDKDLTQVVDGDRVIAFDRRREIAMNEAAVVEKFGVPPRSIPDYLALVGDAADGIPGIPRWGAKSAAAVLSRYGTIDAIPEDPATWDVTVRGAASMAERLNEARAAALLYKRLATLRRDVPITEDLDDLAWHGVPEESYRAFCEAQGFERLLDLPHRWQ